MNLLLVKGEQCTEVHSARLCALRCRIAISISLHVDEIINDLEAGMYSISIASMISSRAYYDKQLDPEHQPSASDIKTLKELQGAKAVFDQQISKKFDKAMKELAKFGYPGKYNPKIIIETQAHTGEVLAHSTTVRYPLYSEGDHQYKLPEQNNGLGYQNLISMSFKLMSFRDSWINGDKHQGDEENDEVRVIPPIHLVLIEEPEAHLHTQVQQVFIKNAYIYRGSSGDKLQGLYQYGS